MSFDDSVRGGEARLWKLIEERTRHGSDVDAIDARLRDLFGETWSIMFTDLAGFSRRVAEFGIGHFLQIIHEHRKLLLPMIEAHDGILVKAEADSFLVLFRRAETALRCAIEMQHECARANTRRNPEEQLLLCVGIGYGELLRAGSDVWGREVNSASKLGEDVAEAGEILLTHAARETIGNVDGIDFEPLDREVKGSPENFVARYD